MNGVKRSGAFLAAARGRGATHGVRKFLQHLKSTISSENIPINSNFLMLY